MEVYQWKLAEIFQSNMMFQREKEMILWGEAAPETEITAKLVKALLLPRNRSIPPNAQPTGTEISVSPFHRRKPDGVTASILFPARMSQRKSC